MMENIALTTLCYRLSAHLSPPARPNVMLNGYVHSSP